MRWTFKNLDLRQKFLLLSSVITVVFAFVLSGIFYSYMKKVVIEDALEKSELILQEVEAIRGYIKDELRPKMYELHGQQDFILEAMSTTYVSMRIMRRFQETMEGYSYRRVSGNPHNPENISNSWEDDKFEYFEGNRQRQLWQGQVSSNGIASFVSVIPDYMEKECLFCHGDAGDAPPALIEKYGNVNGFRFEEGDLAGLNSVSIPISAPLSRLRTLSVMIFLLTLASALVLLVVLNVLFNKLVVTRLSFMVDSLAEGTTQSSIVKAVVAPRGPRDELDSLQASFRQLGRYVRSARKGDDLQPNFIGPYVVGEPVSMGGLSWLYRGHHGETGEQILLKIPFNNLYVNPLYRACLQTELKIVKESHHTNILQAKDQIGDVLVLASLDDIATLTYTEKLIGAKVATLCNQLFDLLAYLHTAGVVHHDLRPGNILITGDGTLFLADFALAQRQDVADTIFESGMGPQGDHRYMAPEQLRGMRGDSRSDIYSLGMLLCFFFTGQLPYPEAGEPVTKKGWLKAKRSSQKIVEKQVGLDMKLIDIIKKSIAFDASERYQWIEDMRDDCMDYLRVHQK
ncbi:MAG: DUF3365 domain-containing protein [Desulfobulbaceae bacterium]|nr:DUF3365 domain-containing protein [Desulfobulbaceae bacterium]